MIKTSILLSSHNSADPFLYKGSLATNKAGQVLPEAVGFVQARAQDAEAAMKSRQMTEDQSNDAETMSTATALACSSPTLKL